MNNQETSERIFRLLSYVFFGVALFSFLGGLIPALFLGRPTAALISALIAIGSILAALLTAWLGFGRTQVTSPAPTDHSEPEDKPKKSRAQWRPEDMSTDEENWLRVHGGPGNKGERHEPDRSDHQE